jgi:VIT1/CCC1 family predicted Fe2+/Mn2+ transporter
VSKDHPHPARYSAERWHRAGSSASLRNFVFGSADGLVTVLAFVAGVSASFHDRAAVLLAGICEMFAGALSMGLGAFMGTRAEQDLYRRERAREEREVREVPHLEREELREIYRDIAASARARSARCARCRTSSAKSCARSIARRASKASSSSAWSRC